jgi:hypothetical protein
VLFDPTSGELTGMVVGSQYGCGPITSFIPKITYSAGYDELPLDLYECLIAILGTLLAGRKAQQENLTIGGMTVDSVQVHDVGNVRLSQTISSGSAFAQIGKNAGYDPLLGPYTIVLNRYRDWRNIIAAEGRPITTFVSSDPDV